MNWLEFGKRGKSRVLVFGNKVEESESLGGKNILGIRMKEPWLQNKGR